MRYERRRDDPVQRLAGLLGDDEDDDEDEHEHEQALIISFSLGHPPEVGE